LTSTNVGIPVVCDINEQCQLNTANSEISCQPNCAASTTIDCSVSDFGFQSFRGPLCYVGQFGSIVNPATLVACGRAANGVKDVCKTELNAAGNLIGSCVAPANCVTTNSVTCTSLDYANKQGPICYVGTFGSTARPRACLKDQFCKRTISTLTPFGMILTTGSCTSACADSATSYCCKTDLCNSYDNTIDNVKCESESYQSSAYPSQPNYPYY
jgi:hypothetical protein